MFANRQIRPPRRCAPAVLPLFLAAIAAPLSAVSAGDSREAPADTVPGGELRERVTSDADPARSYALLLPPGYRGRTPRPLLLVLDPRGRAVAALELFRRPAARHGWIVMSSYDTRSDSAGDGNRAALRAMIADANARLAVDARRIYLAGFSGTARFGWLAARSLGEHAAGLVGVGAGFPPALHALMRSDAATLPATFSFWGGAGRLDFNHGEVRHLDRQLDEMGVRHRIDYYPGGHGWLPPDRAAAALDWLELQAMRTGLAPADEALVDTLHRRALTAARRADAEGRPLEALRRWRRVSEDFAGLRPVGEARTRREELDGHPEVRRRRELRRRQARERKVFLERMTDVLEGMARRPPGLTPSGAADELGLAGLRRRAAGSVDTMAAREAGRRLEQVYVQTSFYLPRRALRAGEPDRALAWLELAERARPGRTRTLWFRARALAQAGREAAALAAVAALLERGFPARRLADDPWLEPLGGTPRWSELIGGPSP